ncbi:secreted frizzled-related protein 3-like [Dendronephthya gigantea]|uniref:secreted frizzled-related protein 3-like n=1 Tax=Dendronephthya gigantea TaxID=151771 RepID=UPI00106D5F8B|nr:secreted frizzled-related protein 3-like [Dendronephthya gigantea]
MAIPWFFLSLFTTALAWQTSYPYDRRAKCEKIVVPLCRTNESKYDQTRLPNFFAIPDQFNVQLFTEKPKIQELVKTKCSEDLVFFLCSVLLPICISESSSTMVPPCRSLCENVYRDCIQSITRLNFTWPGNLNCSGLPDHNEGICIAPNAFVGTTTPMPTTPAPQQLKFHCPKRSQVSSRRKSINQAFLRKYDYVFHARIGRRQGNVAILARSSCTNIASHQIQLKVSCRKKFRRVNGEVLILAKKGKKHMTIEKLMVRLSKNDMNKAIKRHTCSSKKRKNNG